MCVSVCELIFSFSLFLMMVVILVYPIELRVFVWLLPIFGCIYGSVLFRAMGSLSLFVHMLCLNSVVFCLCLSMQNVIYYSLHLLLLQWAYQVEPH